MTFKDIKKSVYASAPAKLKESAALERAFKIYTNTIRSMESKDPSVIVQGIIGLAITLNEPEPPSINESDLVRNDLLIDIIRPIVEKTRLAIFRNTQPPFKTLMEAAQWVYAESKSPIPDDKSERAKKYEEFVDGYLKAEFKGEVWGCGSNMELQHSIVEFPGINENEGFVEKVRVGWSENLCQLDKGVNDILNAVGYPKYAATAHILTGMLPVLPRYSIKSPTNYSDVGNDNWYQRNCVVITINAVDLTFNDLKDIYAEYRKRLNYTRKKSIRDKQLLIHKLVTRKGGVPVKNKMQFWKDILDTWNRENPDDTYKSLVGIYKAYEGICEKLNL